MLYFFATSYLIDKNKKDLTSDDIKTLKDLSANPSDSYLLHFINNMQTVVVTEFKRKLKDFYFDTQHQLSQLYCLHPLLLLQQPALNTLWVTPSPHHQ
jgi:hypothetical protein